VLDQGKLLDVGSHEVLLARDPTYQKMVELQFGVPTTEAIRNIAAASGD
jgi:ABC-type transport system involved in cytochrome bd biosynthesis fused ATPase/permease subunit